MLIGEVARRSGVSARMLRHYDSLGLVRPTGRSVGGYREYSAADIRRILHVEGLRSTGMSLNQIGQALNDPDFTPGALVSELIRKTRERLARERELLERLRSIDAVDPSDWGEVLRVVELLRGLASPNPARRQQAALDPAVGSARLLARAVLGESDENVAGALRWALARSGPDAVSELAGGLSAAEAVVRERAVRALAELPGQESTRVLAAALADPDPNIQRRAALVLGARGQTRVIPTLIRTIVDGVNDVAAAELLGVFAEDPVWADGILRDLVAELETHPTEVPARLRLVQALAELPGRTALTVLRSLTNDDDSTVAALATALVPMVENREN